MKFFSRQDTPGHRVVVVSRVEPTYWGPVTMHEPHCIEAGCGWVGPPNGDKDFAERYGEGHGKNTR